MKEKIYNIMTWVIIFCLVGSLVFKGMGIPAMAQGLWYVGIVLIVIWLILRAKSRKQ